MILVCTCQSPARYFLNLRLIPYFKILYFVELTINIFICADFVAYLFLGGLAAVIYTDTLQAFVMVAGAACLMVISEYYTGCCSHATEIDRFLQRLGRIT